MSFQLPANHQTTVHILVGGYFQEQTEQKDEVRQYTADSHCGPNTSLLLEIYIMAWLAALYFHLIYFVK